MSSSFTLFKLVFFCFVTILITVLVPVVYLCASVLAAVVNPRRETAELEELKEKLIPALM